MNNITKKQLSPKQREELLRALKDRFEKNMNRHTGLEWAKVQAKLEANPEKLWSLSEMESTGGEPDVVCHEASHKFSQAKSFSTMSESATHDAIEALARNSYGRLIAFLASRSGDVTGAEDALSEAFVAALEKWPAGGIPEKPEAWLLRVARNRLIDAARHTQVRQESEEVLKHIAEEV